MCYPGSWYAVCTLRSLRTVHIRVMPVREKHGDRPTRSVNIVVRYHGSELCQIITANLVLRVP